MFFLIGTLIWRRKVINGNKNLFIKDTYLRVNTNVKRNYNVIQYTRFGVEIANLASFAIGLFFCGS